MDRFVPLMELERQLYAHEGYPSRSGVSCDVFSVQRSNRFGTCPSDFLSRCNLSDTDFSTAPHVKSPLPSVRTSVYTLVLTTKLSLGSCASPISSSDLPGFVGG